ncbi:unnamed protein product [Callosobruchus maculatus]|uniref:LITAF domain-containing protein n=1 Tax=Callosobruchus maculatus TaxID=64391 RepID=A0A653C5M0_CALMS|nr:unnamed protein product [Callosobruchus maculatus]
MSCLPYQGGNPNNFSSKPNDTLFSNRPLPIWVSLIDVLLMTLLSAPLSLNTRYCWLCCCLPYFCVPPIVHHYCPNCGAYLGSYD